MTQPADLSEYKWQGFSMHRPGTTKHDRCKQLIEATNQDRLSAYVSRLDNGKHCHVDDLFTSGGHHLIRLVRLAEGRNWVARFRIPSDTGINKSDGDLLDVGDDDTLTQREVDCLQLMSERTTVPVPRVIAFGTSRDGFGAPFMIMECLPGACAMDVNLSFIPAEHKASFYKQMANAQVQTSSLLFPMIGSLTLAEDGKVNIGPIPGIGGPFRTATSFFKAWAATAKFPLAEEAIRAACGPYADDVWQTTSSFPVDLSDLADHICAGNDNGPFPLFHVDFGHNNVVIDSEYNILGVIDWEHAYAAPWEVIDFPLAVRAIPPPMDLPDDYDENGYPTDEDTIARYRDRDQYLRAVKEAEKDLGISPQLSNILGNRKLQNVAAAMRLFKVDGKMGFYSRVLDAYRDST